MFRFLPEPASEIAPKIDWVNNLITDISVTCTILITGVAIYFAIRYRRRPGEEENTPSIHGNDFLEIVWTAIPAVISVYILYWGVRYYNELREVPKNALTVHVTGRKWSWEFEYENGKKTANSFKLPVNKPAKLLLTSQDVLHSFFLPSMRVKMDAIPEAYTYVSFTPVKTGKYRAYCTEYCGDMHWNMLADLEVVSEAEYSRWVNDRSAEMMADRISPAELGAAVFEQKGCNACHSLDGSAKVGPSLLKLFGRKRQLTDGTEIVADENYLRGAILDANQEIVEGYAPNMMPSFEGQLTDKELLGLISFIKSVEEPVASAGPATKPSAGLPDTPEGRGEKLYTEKLCATCHSLEGAKMVGPALNGIVGRKGKLADGKAYTADEEYIKRSIVEPNAELVEGYPGAMPPFGGQLNDEDLNDIIAYLRTTK